MTDTQYDVVVLGAGVAGGHIASRCSEAGLSVALLEHDGFGGTCPLRGCEPKKVLADAAHTAERLLNGAGRGVAGSACLDWRELMAFKRTFTGGLPDRIRRYYEKKGIATYTEAGRFAGPDTIACGGKLLKVRHICIATGAATRRLDIPGAGLLATSRDFLDLDVMPERVVFIGGGFIACELAHIAAVAGADVSVVVRSDRLLRQFDPELVDRLREHLTGLGITFHMNCPPHSVRAASDSGKEAGKSPGGGLELHAGNERFAAGLIVNASGRVPALEHLDLAAGNVRTEQGRGGGGIAVDSHLRSVSNPVVYAAGDAVRRGMPLTPVAAVQAEVVVRNILEGGGHAVEDEVTPYALFTYPPLAAVGMLEEEARNSGRSFDIVSGDAAPWSEYRRIGQKCAGFRLFVEKDSRLLLGAHVLGDGAEETVNLFALAMRKGVTVDELQSMLWAYPSFGYTLKYMFR